MQLKAIRKNYSQLSSFIILCIVSVLTACGSSNPVAPPAPLPTDTPILVGSAQGNTNNLNIRLDTVRILENKGDILWKGDAFFSLLAIRNNGNSAKLILPGQGTYSVFVGDTIRLDEFSLGVNRVTEDELIAVYILAFESDQQTPETQLLIEAILQATIFALETVKYEYPPASIVQFALESLSGEALEWWQEAEVLGEYSFVLSASNDWMRGEKYVAQSLNRNLEITYSIFQSVDITGEIGSDGRVIFTIKNQSSSDIEKVFLSPIENQGWGANRIEENILPNHSSSFSIVAGNYDLRIENSQGLYWEEADLQVVKNVDWVISD